MSLKDQLNRLAALEPLPYPVVSLYLDSRPDARGRDSFATFVRKELKARAQTYSASGDRESLDRDLERIASFLDREVDASKNTIAVFACDAADLFETVQLEPALGDHWLCIADRPHLYPLARLNDQNPRYAVLVADTAHARILVVAQGELSGTREIDGVKTRSTSQGGWSQARYQRHLENYHLHHIKEVVQVLEGIVAREGIDRIVLSADPAARALLREQMPKTLMEKVVDEVSLPAGAPDRDVIAGTLESLRNADARSDRERVDAAVGAYPGGGLGVVGRDATLRALTAGQVDELLIAASLASLEQKSLGRFATASDAGLAEAAVEMTTAGESGKVSAGTVRLADELIAQAQQTGARVRFIEDPSLLEPYDGVAATLRFRV